MKTGIGSRNNGSCVRVAFLLFGAMHLICAGRAEAAVRTWTGGGDGTNWFQASNWDTGAPGDGDDVTVGTGASVALTNATANLSSFTLTNATLTFMNWDTALNATNATILSGGNMRHGICDTNAVSAPTNRVYIGCSNLTIEVGGSINVDYLGWLGSSNTVERGQGLGGGYSQGGGGHGGMSGCGRYGDEYCFEGPKWQYDYTNCWNGPSCGLPDAPLMPGSGGGCCSTLGGAGGGVVRIAATGKVTVNGTISANGNVGSHNYDATGSGGGIYITCQTFTGNTNGIIRANGGTGKLYGNEYFGGTGGGGRIAVFYDTAAQSILNLTARPQVNFAAHGGWHCLAGDNTAVDYVEGRPGSLYFSDSSFYPATVLHGGEIVIPGFTSWSAGSVTSDEGLVLFPPGFQLTVSNALTIDGSRAKLELTTNSALNVGGDLTLTNGGRLYVKSGVTNGAAPDYGFLVSVTSNVNVGAGCWVYSESHATNGGSALFRMRNLTIAATGGINADGKGYRGAPGTAGDGAWGFGPGAGYKQGGGGHGGLGGCGAYGGTNGPVCDSSNAPVQAGSGGGSSGTGPGNRGGGAVRIEALDTVTLNGTISANGKAYIAGFGGLGAGGSIFIRCKTFAGDTNGLLQARGGNGQTYGNEYNGGSGGGGRIAVWRRYDSFQGTASATNGTGYAGTLGQPGTIVWGWLPGPGTVLTIR